MYDNHYIDFVIMGTYRLNFKFFAVLANFHARYMYIYIANLYNSITH